MNFVQCKLKIIRLTNGKEHINDMINLDTVIRLSRKESTKKDKQGKPEFYAIQFECADSKNRLWYFNKESEMRDCFIELERYIIKKSKIK